MLEVLVTQDRLELSDLENVDAGGRLLFWPRASQEPEIILLGRSIYLSLQEIYLYPLDRIIYLQ